MSGLTMGFAAVAVYPEPAPPAEPRPQPSAPAVAGLSDDELLRRAVQNAPIAMGAQTYRWPAVALLFDVDRAAARALCERFGFDPDEAVR